MAKSAAFSNSLLKLIFNGAPIPGIADNAASSASAQLYVALHTADPGASGNQATGEASYAGYARVPVARDTTGWSVIGQAAYPVATVSFPIGTGGSGTASNFSVGTAASGPGEILYVGQISPPIVLGSGVTPQFSTGSEITES